MSDKSFYITCSILLIFVAWIIGFSIHNDIRTDYKVWFNQCIEKGGIPSKYEVIENKNTKREYLCIKPESIIQ